MFLFYLYNTSYIVPRYDRPRPHGFLAGEAARDISQRRRSATSTNRSRLVCPKFGQYLLSDCYTWLMFTVLRRVV